jgi:hypothetical protein
VIVGFCAGLRSSAISAPALGASRKLDDSTYAQSISGDDWGRRIQIEPVIDAKRNHLEVGVMHIELIGN